MADVHDPWTPTPQPPSSPNNPPLTVLPVRDLSPRVSPLGRVLRWLFRTLFAASLGFNLLLVLMVVGLGAGMGDGVGQLRDRYHSGKKSAGDKVAVVRIDGVIMEGLTGYAQKQIEEA